MKNKLVLLAISGYSLSVYAQQQVNFVLINLDDCGYGDFSYKGGAMGYTTPNIDKMAAEGGCNFPIFWRRSLLVGGLLVQLYLQDAIPTVLDLAGGRRGGRALKPE